MSTRGNKSDLLTPTPDTEAPAKGVNSGLEKPLCLADYEKLARERLSPAAWGYYESGSGDDVTVAANRSSLARLCLMPRVMVDVSTIDTSINLLGRAMPHPILLAPASTHMLAHPDGEVATARGAGVAEAILVVSTNSNCSIEEIAQAATQPLWFQLYVEDDRATTKDLIERAEAAGSTALCITVDLPVVYARTSQDRALRQAASQFWFPHLKMTAGPGGLSGPSRRGRKFTWKDLEWIQSFTKIPILLKGILNPLDAELAVNTGVAGIVVSNHGGRGLDTVPATIDALPAVVERMSGRIPVLIDGGIRRGTDVLKCLALGATAVMVGRPYLYGLAVDGADGVRDVIQILRAELEAAMALTGRTSIAAIDRDLIW